MSKHVMRYVKEKECECVSPCSMHHKVHPYYECEIVAIYHMVPCVLVIYRRVIWCLRMSWENQRGFKFVELCRHIYFLPVNIWDSGYYRSVRNIIFNSYISTYYFMLVMIRMKFAKFTWDLCKFQLIKECPDVCLRVYF